MKLLTRIWKCAYNPVKHKFPDWVRSKLWQQRHALPTPRTSQPLVSIVVASYNYAQYIGKTLESLLTQTYTNIEVVVIDDGSSDNSCDIAASYAARDSRVRLYRHPDKKNHGLPATIQYATSLCHGQYIAFCESDDMLLPDNIARKVQELNRYPDGTIGIISNAVTLTGCENAKLSDHLLFIYSQLHSGFNHFKQAYSDKINFIPTFSCVMIRADLLRNANFDSPVPAWLDKWIYRQVMKDHPLYHITDRLTLWRMHPTSFNTLQSDQQKAELWRKAINL